VTKEAITRNPEAMKSRNFYGTMIFDAGDEISSGNNRFTFTNIVLNNDFRKIRLEPSGLMGPIRIMEEIYQNR
jgi:hypothetical protein